MHLAYPYHTQSGKFVIIHLVEDLKHRTWVKANSIGLALGYRDPRRSMSYLVNQCKRKRKWKNLCRTCVDPPNAFQPKTIFLAVPFCLQLLKRLKQTEARYLFTFLSQYQFKSFAVAQS